MKSSTVAFRSYNRHGMDTLAHILSEILVPLFFVGMVGSILVVIFTVVRDLRQVLTSDEDTDGADL
jgi:hypothetical protein